MLNNTSRFRSRWPRARQLVLVALAGASVLSTVSASAGQTRNPSEAASPSQDQLGAMRTLVAEDLLNDPASPVLGNRAGDITMVEFFDYRCPYCKAMAPKLKALLEKDAGLRLVMKESPILSPQSIFAAKVALVAQRHGVYDAFHAAMYALNGPFDDQTVLLVAQSVGLSPATVRQEITDESVLAELRRNLALGEIIGVKGTPAFIIGTGVVPGAVSIDTLGNLLAAARKKQKG